MTAPITDIHQVRRTTVSGIWVVDQDWTVWRLEEPLASAARAVLHHLDVVPHWGAHRAEAVQQLIALLEVSHEYMRSQGVLPVSHRNTPFLTSRPPTHP